MPYFSANFFPASDCKEANIKLFLLSRLIVKITEALHRLQTPSNKTTAFLSSYTTVNLEIFSENTRNRKG